MNQTIRQELWDGASIEEVLIKYHISFKELWDMFCHYDVQPYKKGVKQHHDYILERKGSFTVRKSICGKTKMFGVYNSLEDAILMRERFEEDGWHQRNVDRLCEEMGVERRKNHPNCHVRYR